MKIQGIKELGLSLNKDQLEQFHTYLKELQEWNNRINLTSLTTEEDIKVKHFLDSLSLAKSLDLSKEYSLLDIGSGAGFPGLPLKIVFPNLKITLVDSVKKKVNFMNHIIEILKLTDIHAVFSRSEDLLKDFRGSFDIVTSRAVADLRILSEYCLPYVKIDGIFAAYKSKDIEEELNLSKNAIKTLGGNLERTYMIKLPGTDIIRSLILVKKVSRTPDNFPRRAGIAQKRPL